jgi:hypothetical protein
VSRTSHYWFGSGFPTVGCVLVERSSFDDYTRVSLRAMPFCFELRLSDLGVLEGIEYADDRLGRCRISERKDVCKPRRSARGDYCNVRSCATQERASAASFAARASRRSMRSSSLREGVGAPRRVRAPDLRFWQRAVRKDRHCCEPGRASHGFRNGQSPRQAALLEGAAKKMCKSRII